ncbi:hypothetical protein [Glaciecola sp. 1036]|uniref:hypothetical protein n=1 Tax=Alteromonadaceae TaxID=72275 RepID=UPI003D01E1FF
MYLHKQNAYTKLIQTPLFLITTMLFMMASQTANAALLSWDNATLLKGNSLDDINPLVLFGFNPQPEPPALPSTKPTFVVEDVENPQVFDLGFAIASEGNVAPLMIELLDTPIDDFSSLTLMVKNQRSLEDIFQVNFEFSTSSGGVIDLDSLSFNPQPEPPAEFRDGGVFGMNFSFTSLSDVWVSFEVLNINNQAISFSRVSAPSTVLLLSFAVFGLLRRRGNRA